MLTDSELARLRDIEEGLRVDPQLTAALAALDRTAPAGDEPRDRRTSRTRHGLRIVLCGVRWLLAITLLAVIAALSVAAATSGGDAVRSASSLLLMTCGPMLLVAALAACPGKVGRRVPQPEETGGRA